MLVQVPNQFLPEVRKRSEEELRYLSSDAAGFLSSGKTPEQIVRSMEKVGWSPEFSGWLLATLQANQLDVELAFPRVPTMEEPAAEEDKPFNETPATGIPTPIQFAPITDNPFRLAALSSDSSLEALARASRSIATRLKIGQKPDIALTTTFGDAGLEHLEQYVRIASADAKALLENRMWWASSPEMLAQVGDPNGDFQSESQAQQIQWKMLKSWFMFEYTHHPSALRHSLDAVNDFVGRDEIDGHYVALVQDEEKCTPEKAQDIVFEVQNRVVTAALTRASEICVFELNRSNEELARELLTVILQSPIDDEMEEKALSPVLTWGNELSDTGLADMETYFENDRFEAPLPESVTRLAKLAAGIGERHPVAKEWRARIEDWHEAYANRLRFQAVEMSVGSGDHHGAKRLINLALTVAPESIKPTLKDDLKRIDEMARGNFGGLDNDPSMQLKEIGSAPPLFTLNGFGFMLYGNQPYQRQSNLEFSTLYLTALFIPIFPLARYLVESTGEKQWAFHAKSRWTNGMKIHLAVASVFFIWFCYAVANYEPTGDPYATPGNPYSSSYDYSGNSTTGNSDLAAPLYSPKYADDPRLTKLQMEFEQLDKNLSALKLKMVLDESDVKEAEAELSQLNQWLDKNKPPRNQRKKVAAWNKKVDEYNAKQKAYKTKLNDYNASVKSHNKKVERQREIHRVLQEAGL